LNQSVGVNYYLAEYPYAFEAFCNLYLETGDEKLFTFLANESKGTHAVNADNFEL
jgi:hypothetical protein